MLKKYHALSDKLFPLLPCALVLTALVADDGGQPVAAMLFLLSLPLFLVQIPERNIVAPVSSRWVLAFVLPICVSVPLFLSSGTGEALAGGARYLLAIITLLALTRVRLDMFWFLRAASASGMLAIALNLGQLHLLRVDWGAGFLGSAYIGVLLLSLSVVQLRVDFASTFWRSFGILGILCLLIVTIKTGSRGIWPAILLIFFIHFMSLNISRWKKVLTASIGTVLVIATVVSMPSVKQRINLTIHEIQTYYENGNHASSMGYRLDFWRIAMLCFREGPLFGVSYQKRSELMEEYVKNYPQSHSLGNDGRSSSHNEILNAMAKRGVFGVLAVLLLYLIPLRYFCRQYRQIKNPKRRSLALAGASCVLVILICGLTEAPLMNVRVGTTFAFLMVVIYHLLNQLDIEDRILFAQDQQN
ncbi:MAG: O-antigen ligase family protein [Acidiferrobacterales bacterium]|nr:O-antigen ligase family protein [Acidiferrobacterales bacterium]